MTKKPVKQVAKEAAVNIEGLDVSPLIPGKVFYKTTVNLLMRLQRESKK